MRNVFVFVFCFSCLPTFSQNYTEIKTRFNNYLNYGSLEKTVEISPTKIIFYKTVAGKKETDFEIPKESWEKLSMALQSLPSDSFEILYKQLKEQKSIPTKTEGKKEKGKDVLSGIKICIDPGHIAGNMKMARVEQKYLHFSKEIYTDLKVDSVDISEGVLTFQTASILKKMLEEKGAEVVLTRQNNSTTFGYTYEEWLKKNKRKVLDSLLSADKITHQKHKQLVHMSASTFFVEFFKDYELQNRARVINKFNPDLTAIIHYNVNEKNVPWLKPSDKDFCMAFIPGCFIPDNIQSPTGKINLLRLLLTKDLDESEKISSLLVSELSKQLNIPIAKPSDASYLNEHCTPTPSAGVYCRTLALCRLAHSPLVYGECLYQDSDKECYELIKNTENLYGVQTNKRVILAAQSYLNAIVKYYSN